MSTSLIPWVRRIALNKAVTHFDVACGKYSALRKRELTEGREIDQLFVYARLLLARARSVTHARNKKRAHQDLNKREQEYLFLVAELALQGTIALNCERGLVTRPDLEETEFDPAVTEYLRNLVRRLRAGETLQSIGQELETAEAQ